MEQLIKITEENGKRLVDARELHEFMDRGQKFIDWIQNGIEKLDL
jgi:phage anti-repressor protein